MQLTNLFTKLQQLRTAVPGMRERFRYEESFGMPHEEFFHLKTPTGWQIRILSQVEFALRMAEVETDTQKQEKLSGPVEDTLDFLLGKIGTEGSLSNSSCQEAERRLLALKAEAKTYALILAAHAHIDMNWMWGWDETVAATVNSFKTMLRMMDEYPDFHFSQSQASCYKIIEDYAPELKDKIRQRIQEGRWEITASAWVETDKNMPSTDSLLKHMHYTRKYLSENWGVDPESIRLDFSPDTFGHSKHIPTINNLGGLKWYYHCRGNDGDHVLYRWRSDAGKEILVYREPYWYNSAITPLIGTGLPDISRRCGGFRTGLIVYGVGDHGGGPTRRDLEKAIEMMNWPVFPSIRFGRITEFFAEAEAAEAEYPVRSGEQNFFAPGCFTTQSEIKKGNRQSERALRDAEIWGSLAHLFADSPYREEIFETAWQKVLLTHFHDILTGSNTPDSKAHALGIYQEAIAAAETRTNLSLSALSDRIDTETLYLEKADLFDDAEKSRLAQSEGAGAGYGLDRYGFAAAAEMGRGLGRVFNLFNSTAHTRHEYVELTVWDWTGDLRRLSVLGADGKELRFVLLDHELQQYWDHKFFRLLVEADVPALGYTTLLLYQGPLGEYPIYYQNPIRTSQRFDNMVLENDAIRAIFCSQSGRLKSLVDKVSGEERITDTLGAGFVFVDTERRSSNAWNIGRYLSKDESFQMIESKPLGDGKQLQGFEMKLRYRQSTISSRVTLKGNEAKIDFDSEIDWQEVTRENSNVPLLIFHIPTEAEGFLFDVPGGTILRPAQNIDVPGLTYGAAIYGSRSTMLISESKYGYRADHSGIAVSLLNSTYSPDPYPEFGKHKTRFSVAVSDSDEAEMNRLSEQAVLPIRYHSAGVHSGDLDAEQSLLDLDTGTAKLNGLRVEQDKLLLTLTAGTDATDVDFTLPERYKNARISDMLLGNIDGAELTDSGDKQSLRIAAENTIFLTWEK